MSLLELKKKAPAFSLKDGGGALHKLSEVDADYTVVYFYPKDNTPGCTTEAVEFSKELSKFRKLGAEVIGISGGDEKTKTKFCSKHKLKVLLLSDPEFKVSSKYGTYGEKQFMGRKFMGISRITYILDKNKNVAQVFSKVKAQGHAKEVLDAIKELKA